MIKRTLLLLAFTGVLLLSSLIIPSCKKETPIPDPVTDNSTYNPTPYIFDLPAYFPKQMLIPDDNPMTVEGVELGRMLFYDGRFGGRSDPDSLMSCCTCHSQQSAFECGLVNPDFPEGRPYGITGINTPHVMMSQVNLVFNANGYLWNGTVSGANPNPRKQRLEDVPWMALYAPDEIFSDSNRSRNLISSIEGYKPLFKAAFGTEEITFKLMSYAIAQFVRSLIACDSKFDRWLQGQTTLTQSEHNGFILFITEEGADCFHCHGGDGNPLFTNNLFFNNGKDVVFTDPGDRYSVTGDPMDIGAYRAPTLRNIELTGPYMHDGRYKTLDEVINFYSDSVVWSPSISPLMHKVNDGGARLTLQEKADLKAFLLTLTDYTLTTDPAHSPPASLPQ